MTSPKNGHIDVNRELLYYYWEVEWNDNTYYIMSRFDKALFFAFADVTIITLWKYYSDGKYTVHEYDRLMQSSTVLPTWHHDDALFGTVQVFAMSSAEFIVLVQGE